MFFIQKLVNNNLFKNNHIIILWNVLQVIGFQSTRAYFKGRAYIKIILKNHVRCYCRGNTVEALVVYHHACPQLHTAAVFQLVGP